MKTCTACHEEKPLDAFYKDVHGNSKSKCRPCYREYTRKRAEQGRSPTKTCNSCREVKDRNDFYRQGNHGTHGSCKDCRRTRARERYEQNRTSDAPYAPGNRRANVNADGCCCRFNEQLVCENCGTAWDPARRPIPQREAV